MKRVGNLYEQVIDIENIKLAIHNASKTKKKHRVVKKINKNADEYAMALHNNFRISGDYRKKIHIDNSSQKERLLEIPPFYPDQIVQHALVKITLPYIEKRFIAQTCCSIKKRGSLYASELARKYIRSGCKYFVKLDIRKYFPNIDRQILKDQLKRIFKDKNILSSYFEIIDSTEKGLPIGNYTSQPLANLYLTPLDRFIKETLKVKYYIRYMDDIVILSKNKRKLKKLIKPIKDFISTLKLETHNDEIVYSLKYTPLDFCAYRHYSTHTTIRRRVCKRIIRCLKRNKKYVITKRMKRGISYYGYILHSNSCSLVNRYLKGV